MEHPDVLRTLNFSADHLYRVKDFHCGEEPYAAEVAQWIQCTNPDNSALQDLRMKEHGFGSTRAMMIASSASARWAIQNGECRAIETRTGR